MTVHRQHPAPADNAPPQVLMSFLLCPISAEHTEDTQQIAGLN